VSQANWAACFFGARHVEFVDDANLPVSIGEQGRILVTDLENHLFPLIRYENGDRGRLLRESCPCGISLPLMDKVAGRVSDTIVLPDGTLIAGDYLNAIFDPFPDAVKKFQIRQKRDRSIQVLYVPAEENAALRKALASVEVELSKRTRGQVSLVFQALEEIPNDRGKLRFIISER
jgi:phenylacetate-CoA ligase